MTTPTLIITIDTEGDNLWTRPEKVTTENARFVPRFQALCEEFGFKPTYLVNYEMATDPLFQEFGRSVVRRRTAEIGLHVHPWHSPPPVEAYDRRRPHIYLYDLPDDLLYAKVSFLHGLLIDVFDVRPMSHRAGKWGFDERVAKVLADLGYLVDCSVTPGISWRRYRGAPNGRGGPDYVGFPMQPYFLDLRDIKSPGSSSLLEVPMTVKPNYRRVMQRMYHAIEGHSAARGVRKLFGSPYLWFRPNGKNLKALLALVDWAVQQRLPVLEFMLHSSELMPGGSPTFQAAAQVERLYAHLTQVFGRVRALGVSSMTLAEFRATPGLADERPAEPSMAAE